MPKISLRLPETYTSITRPVVLDVFRALAVMTGVGEDARLSYSGVADGQPLFASRTNTPKQQVDNAHFRHEGVLWIDVVENFDENELLTTPVHYPDALMVFQDPKIAVELKPVYVAAEVTMTVNYRARDLRAAQAWLGEIRRRISEGRAEHVHKADYQYPIPKEYMLILHEIYKLRESNAGYGEDFRKWFYDHASKKITTLTKMDGTEPLLVVDERQEGIMGWFDFTTPPKEERGESGSLWLISFDYKFKYEKPIEMAMSYPIVVHNQLLPHNYRGDNGAATWNRIEGDMSLMNQRFDFFRQQSGFYDGNTDGIIIPYFDDWVPKLFPRATRTVISALIGVNPNDPTRVCNLHELPDYQITPLFMDYLKESHDWLGRFGGLPFLITVYSGDTQIAEDNIVIDESLEIRTAYPMDLRSIYHVRLGILMDLSLLQESALERLLNNPEVCLAILKIIDPNIERKGLLPSVVGGKRVNKNEWWRAVRGINSTHEQYRSPATIMLSRVGLFTIVTKSGEPE